MFIVRIRTGEAWSNKTKIDIVKINQSVLIKLKLL